MDGPKAIGHIPIDHKIIAYSNDDKVLAPNADGLVREMKTKKVVSREEVQERTETEDVKHFGDFSDEVSKKKKFFFSFPSTPVVIIVSLSNLLIISTSQILFDMKAKQKEKEPYTIMVFPRKMSTTINSHRHFSTKHTHTAMVEQNRKESRKGIVNAIIVMCVYLIQKI